MIKKLLDWLINWICGFLNEKRSAQLRQAYSKLISDSTEGSSARAAGIVFMVRIASAVLAFALQVFLARWMGAEQYGIFVYIWVVIVLVSGFSCLGFQTSVIRFVTEYRTRRDIRKLNGILFAAPVVAIVLSMLAGSGAFIVLYHFGPALTDTGLMPIYLALFCLPFLALEEIQEGIARSFDMPLTAIGPPFIVRPASVLFTMVIAYLIGFPANAITAFYCAIVSSIFATALQSYFLWRGMKQHRLKEALLPEWNQSGMFKRSRFQFDLRYWVGISLPIFIAGTFNGLLFHCDVLLVGLLLNAESVAIYYAALKSLAFIHFVLYAMRAASIHHFSRFYSTGDMAGLSAYANRMARWTFWPSVVIATVMIVLGKYVLMLFGEEFMVAQSLLSVLALGIVVRAAIGPIDALLTMTGQQHVAMGVMALSLLCNTILNVSLVPIIGVLGAAVATAIVLGIEAIALYIAVDRRLGIKVSVFNYDNEPGTGELAS